MKLHWQTLDRSLMRTAITIAIALFSATAAQGQSARYVVSGHHLKLSFFQFDESGLQLARTVRGEANPRARTWSRELQANRGFSKL